MYMNVASGQMLELATTTTVLVSAVIRICITLGMVRMMPPSTLRLSKLHGRQKVMLRSSRARNISSFAGGASPMSATSSLKYRG